MEDDNSDFFFEEDVTETLQFELPIKKKEWVLEQLIANEMKLL